MLGLIVYVYMFARLSYSLSPFTSRLVEQTLDSCQLKRIKSAVVKVDLRWLCNHLQRWSLLNRDFNLQELALFAVFAKQASMVETKYVRLLIRQFP